MSTTDVFQSQLCCFLIFLLLCYHSSSSDHGNVIGSNSRHAPPLQRSESFDRGHPSAADTNRHNVDYHILHGGSLRAPAMMNRHHDPYSMSAARGL